jgi:dedicator of cytokinesis protein 3
MIINEYGMNEDFQQIERAIIHHLTSCFSDQMNGTSSFLNRLRQTAVRSKAIEDALLTQIIAFLDQAEDYLILLGDTRDLPDGSEFDVDRVSHNLRRMTVRTFPSEDHFLPN